MRRIFENATIISLEVAFAEYEVSQFVAFRMENKVKFKQIAREDLHGGVRMKRLMILATGIFLLIIAGIIAINIQQTDTDITKQKTKVGFILNGTIDDSSWGQSHYEAMEISKQELNLEITYQQNVPEDERSVEYMEELIADGCEIVICNSFGYGTYEIQVAEKHPEVHFFHATGVEETDNLSTYFGRMYQIRYLCGMVAGLQTETNEIGYVAAFDISEVNRGINAFAQGVRKVNPDAKVYVRFCNSWLDDESAKLAAEALMDQHAIDVVSVHTDSLAVYEEAQKRDVWIIGYNHDNSEMYPDHFLTAGIWKWENFYTARIREVLQDKFVSQHYWEGIESGIVALAPFTNHVKPGIESQVKAEQEKIERGEFDVFYGPIYDNEGNLRVGEDESMTDEAMLNDFNWYVEGVVIDEE